ncbi:thioredoxin [Chromatiales bacterium (ex Bugula neritina AB1)]|nr:thioredoxin [Chromatiales bacterium (ex Bugula neritina AB1)]
MADSPYIVDVTKENFESVILHGSMQTPILIDFWADWCGPCKSLMPVLAKLADEYQGAFILAKIDTEAEQEIAAQLGIRSLPTVKLIVNGAAVDEFSGALPENEVRAFLEKHIGPAMPVEPADDDPLVAAANLHAQGNTGAAVAMLREAQAATPENGDIAIALGQMCVATGEFDDARQCLSILSDDDAKKPEAEKLKGLLTLSDADDSSRDEAAVASAFEKDPTDHDAAYQLGIKQALRSDFDAAVNTLLGLMIRDREYGDDGARKAVLSIFEVMGSDPQVGVLRRKMFNLLH